MTVTTFGYVATVAALSASSLVLYLSFHRQFSANVAALRVFSFAALIALVSTLLNFYLAASLPDDEVATATRTQVIGTLAIVMLLAGLIVALWRMYRIYHEERRLGDRSRTFQTLFNITRGGLMLIDSRGRIINVNPSCMPLFGYERTQLMAMHLQELIDSSSAGLSGALGLVDDAEGSGVIETVARRKDGQLLHLQLTSAAIPQSGGQIFVIFRDITERKHAEEIHARLEAQLRHSQKIEAIGTLASGIAHDFNNVLSAILGNIELALHDLDKHSPVIASMIEIRKAGQRAKELVGRIVGFARPQDNKARVLPLQDVVEDAVKLVRATLPASITLDCRFAANVPPVHIDDSQINQLLLNLCTNAYQATEGSNGAIEITIDVRDISVDESAQHAQLRAGTYVCMDVRDNGRGISPAIADRVFEPFFTTKPRGEGTGLGLSIAHTIVRGHGGVITFDSKPGEGTTFHVLLPAVTTDISEMAEPEVAATVPAQQGSQQHILYVDDEEPLVFLTKRLLERQGYRVTGFTDPKVALAEFMANCDAFDLFITDQSMPGINGIDLAREVLSKKPDTRIILVSGYLSPEDIALARSVGVREVILKPNSVDELVAAVHRIVLAVP